MAGDIAFAKTSTNPIDKRMEISAYFLAKVKVLKGEQAGYDKIRDILLTIANDYVQSKNKLAAAAGKWMTGLLLTAPGRMLIKQLAAKTKKTVAPRRVCCHPHH